jgi:hypothetical protein
MTEIIDSFEKSRTTPPEMRDEISPIITQQHTETKAKSLVRTTISGGLLSVGLYHLIEADCESGFAGPIRSDLQTEKADGRYAAGFRMQLSVPAPDSTASVPSVGPDG